MALQDGFVVLNLDIVAPGTGYGNEDTEGVLLMRSPGSQSLKVGNGFQGEYSCTDDGRINGADITTAGKNYSSGSWNIAGGVEWGAPGEFCSISILGTSKSTPATGTGAIIIPKIGQNKSMSFSDINRERGVAIDTANSDIHDLYEDFSSVAGTVHTDVSSKPNFDWFQGGPQSGSASHPIRLDEFYGSTYDSYGGIGCLGIGTPITLANGTVKNIEDINVGDTIKSANVPGMPLDFDEEDTWSTWSGIPHGNAPNSVWATAYYDIQELNRASPQTAAVMDIYFDYYDNYYLINGTLKATYEHPFFILRDGGYYFKTTASLQIGDKLFKDTNDFEEVTSIDFVNEQLETVNLNVESLDVYFGGGYLMHNVHGK
jgi:hypothetical protein|tara:strand:+ start:653 stop:1771 length:1119 start_codon:yes stop_codon:yes gene_type:complete